MSDDDNKDDNVRQLHAVQTELDKTAAAWDEMSRVWIHVCRKAVEIAMTRRALYLAYLSQGFTEVQALDLCKSIAL